ncbi:MAG: hypothetical protein WAV32_06955 [Halobacteriota archaeon]
MVDRKWIEELEEKTAEELILVGEEYQEAGKHEEAIEIYKAIVRKEPLLHTLAKVCNDCGVAYASLEQYDMAIGFFNAALNLSGYLIDEGISTCYNLGRVYRITRDEEKAQQYFRRAERLEEDQKDRNEVARCICST